MTALLGEMADAIAAMDEDVTHAYDQINDLSEELEDLEADLYEDEDAEDEDDDAADEDEDAGDDDNARASPSMRWPAPPAARPSTSARMTWMQGKLSAPTAV